MKNKFGVLYTVFSCFLTALLFALTVRGERLPLKIYTSADGLGSSFVDFIYKDSRDFMWFATRDGLSRFDGSRFVTYRVGKNDQSPGVENIYEAKNGVYWISTTGGTYRFDPNSIFPSSDPLNPKLDAEHITDGRGQFFEDSAGNFWFGSAGLFRLEEENGKTVLKKFDLNLPPKPDTTFIISDLSEASDGSLWINTSWGLVRRLPDQRIIFYPYEIPVNSGNSSMLLDKSGRLWLTRSDQILILKPEPPESFGESAPLSIKSLAPTEVIDALPEENIQFPKKGGDVFQLKNDEIIAKLIAKRIFQTADGHIWIADENYLLEFAEGILHLHSDAEGLPNVMGRMGEDTAGNLWIGGQAGVARLDRNGLVTFRTADGVDSPRFFSISEAADGTLYLGGRDYYLNRFDGKQFKTLRPEIAPDSQNLWTSRSSFLDSTGDWWILTTEKLYRFSGAKDFSELENLPPTKIYTTENGLKSNGMFQIFEDSAGDLWVSTRGTSGAAHGIARLKKGEENFRVFTEAEGVPRGKAPSSFAEDAFGNIWMGFYEGGVMRFDGERFEYFGEKDGFPASGLISDLHLDIRGRLWLGSSIGGLIQIDDTSAKTPSLIYLTTADGLVSNNVRTVTEDRFGRIYIGTASGVDRITPDTGRIKHYSVNDGLAADFVVDSHRDKNGNLWFATNNGASRLIPLPDEKSMPPRILLGGLRIAGVEQAISKLGNSDIEKGELSHTENNLQIEFFGLDFRAGESLRYQYKLEGADSDWSAPSEQTAVTFANLSPGEYRFLVLAVNSEGVKSETPATVSFRVLPPVWRRWWFLLFCALVASFIIILLYRYRTARLREINLALAETNRAEEALRKSREERIAELEKVRSRIATDLHDDIGSSLTQIAILSEVAQAQSKNGLSEPLKVITDVSNELVATMSDIVWSINPAKDHLADLTQRMRRFASDVLSAKGISLHFEAPESKEEIIIGTNLRREVFLIFKESVNNIVRHSGAEQVKIALKISVEDLILTVRDNGHGFDTSKKDAANSFEDDSRESSGNGIVNMRKRAKEMNGEIEIDSRINQGTEITLRLPLDKTAQTGGAR